MYIYVDTSAHIFKLHLQTHSISLPPPEFMDLHTGGVFCIWQVEFSEGDFMELPGGYKPFGQEIPGEPGT